ncbi:ABC transporter substrate-binding protein [Microbacterium hominis]|uniref:Carbohydrate ABC transporter substrate-binding protein n=1 Tax=Microbacterium hominis TaxID=162426 RepID=A0A7D4TSA5_9MICO|nr:ABC transporter substrate-binding protein [Microbacterium hominis]QKJ20644.1 carbohydrate ABC transporter substrate-binding protein [Microbacterium hominis]
MNTRSHRRSVAAIGIALAAVMPLAACAGGGSSSSGDGSGDGTDPEAFTVMTANENPVLEEQLTALAEGACEAENEALPLEHQKVAQADTVQKVTLLASQGALPTHTIAGTALIRPDGDLNAAGLVGDLKAALEGSGAWENVLPAAASTVEQVYGGMYSMPYQYNIEGIWYNKQILADNGVEEPQTWDEFVDASQTLLDAGVVPMTEAGANGWPLTRLMGMYIFRNVGPEAMAAVRDGDSELTSADYVAGAQALADYAAAGYFGEGFSTRDGDTSSNMFLTGKAAMTYDGSWFLSAINDPERNQIGEDNIGFMPFPAVDGGAGSIDQYAANAGAPMIINAEQFGPKVVDWISCIAENYGQQALQSAGVISGFEVNGEVTDIPTNTAAIQERIAGIDETVLWFEALMDSQSNSLASTNVTLLTTGQMSPEDYMTELQASIDGNR